MDRMRFSIIMAVILWSAALTMWAFPKWAAWIFLVVGIYLFIWCLCVCAARGDGEEGMR